MTAGNIKDVLRGTTREVYRFLVENGGPVGIRETQRALSLSSPSVAAYHLHKLERADLVKREKGNYRVSEVLLEHNIRLRHFLIPKYLFYSVFALAVLIIELTLFRPSIIHRGYFFSAITTLVFFIIFCYETVKTWRRGNL